MPGPLLLAPLAPGTQDFANLLRQQIDLIILRRLAYSGRSSSIITPPGQQPGLDKAIVHCMQHVDRRLSLLLLLMTMHLPIYHLLMIIPCRST